MPNDPKPLPGMPSAYLDDWMLQELKGEGFPDWMIDSFILTAKETNTIILSRTPGGAGLDLIENNYDLKGFQIKAKSCDWGPMAGFICQLPFFNKAGFSKVSYNTGYIMHYLDCLDSFSGNKQTLNKIKLAKSEATWVLTTAPANVDFDVNETAINITKHFNKDRIWAFGSLSRSEQIATLLAKNPINKTEIQKVVDAEFDEQISDTVIEYQSIEQKIGEWSGENSIEGDSPFIHLKRIFAKTANQLKDALKERSDILKVEIIPQGIYGVAQSSDKSVTMEFLLKNEGSSMWSIYHGRIKYVNKKKEKKDYIPNLKLISPDYYLSVLDKKVRSKYPITFSNSVSLKKAEKNKKLLDSIFNFSSDSIIDVNVSSGKNFSKGKVSFYPLCGFVNPHPPYGTDQNFKNAVSGDYDLFAFWPNAEVSYRNFTRLTETYLNKDLKIIISNNSIYIEMIPGFDEINPSSKNDRLKESAELGNINPLGSNVAGTLNSFSNSIPTRINNSTKVLNRAFHSDEGGRPGVMEVEFPIAIFFPSLRKTKSLNNQYKNGKAPPFLNRKPLEIESWGGLIKTPEELMDLIMNVIKPGMDFEGSYIAVLQSDWMSHLFYISLPDNLREKFHGQVQPFDKMFKRLNTQDENGKKAEDIDKQSEKVKDKLKEFETIWGNHTKIFPKPSTFDRAKFEENLKELFDLRVKYEVSGDKFSIVPGGWDEKFEKLRMSFLEIAFKSKREAALRKLDIEQILFGN